MWVEYRFLGGLVVQTALLFATASAAARLGRLRGWGLLGATSTRVCPRSTACGLLGTTGRKRYTGEEGGYAEAGKELFQQILVHGFLLENEAILYLIFL